MYLLLSPICSRFAIFQHHVIYGRSLIRTLTSSKLSQYYDLLQVDKNASTKHIRENFLKLSKIHHPDNKVSGNHGKFVELKEAYDALKNGHPVLDESSYEASRQYTNPSWQRQSDNSTRTESRAEEFPWEEIARRRAEKQSDSENPIKFFQARPLIALTIFISGLSWIFIHACVVFIIDRKTKNKTHLEQELLAQNNRDFMAYQDYLQRQEATFYSGSETE